MGVLLMNALMIATGIESFICALRSVLGLPSTMDVMRAIAPVSRIAVATM